MNLIILILSLNSFAESFSESQFTIGDKKTTIYHYKDQRVSISEKCDGVKNNRFCESIQFLKDLPKTIRKANLAESTGGSNPGSNICEHVLKGIVVMGIDAKNNENSFCKLPSGLLIDSGTLTYYSKQ